MNSSIHVYKECTLKIWNITEFRIGYEFHHFREEIAVMNLENEVVSSQFRKEIRCHNNAGKAELSFL